LTIIVPFIIKVFNSKKSTAEKIINPLSMRIHSTHFSPIINKAILNRLLLIEIFKKIPGFLYFYPVLL